MNPYQGIVHVSARFEFVPMLNEDFVAKVLTWTSS